jgi:nucleoporin NDC1
LALLTCASLKEDQYGLVQKQIVRILESFCTTLAILERYTADPPIHWTDVESRNSPRPSLREPEKLIAELKTAIHNIDEAFRSYNIIPDSLRNKLPKM